MTSDESDPRIADTLDETCHNLQETADRVDDDEADGHLQLAISHLEHVARWDREERGETPTDALRDFVTDGGVDQDDRSVPEQIRDTIEASEHPELTVREVTQSTGLTEQQVYSTAGSMDRLELDRRVGVVRLPEDDGGEFVDDPEQELVPDGGVDQGDEDHQCGYCGATALAYQLESGKGPVVRCIPCLAIEQGSQKLGQPFEVFVDFSPSVVYDSEEEKRESQKNSYEVARSWYTVLGRIQQDEPIIKRDPDDFGTVHEWVREFLTNIMGADAHKRPSDVAGGEVAIGQAALSGGDDGE